MPEHPSTASASRLRPTASGTQSPIPTHDCVPDRVPPVGDADAVAVDGSQVKQDQSSTASRTQSSLPEWLIAKLAADNPDGITRAARLTRCDHCGARVLRGLDDERCAIAVEVTPLELDHFGEYLALARGLRTFHLAHRFSPSGTRRWEIDPRYPASIERHRRRYAVVPQHRCGIWLPATTDGLLLQKRAPVTNTNNPPF